MENDITDFKTILQEIDEADNTIALEVIVEGSALQRDLKIDYSVSYTEQAKKFKDSKNPFEVELSKILLIADEKFSQLENG